MPTQPLFQFLGVRPRACKLAGTVEQTGGNNFYIKGKKKKENSSLSNQVHNSPVTFDLSSVFLFFYIKFFFNFFTAVFSSPILYFYYTAEVPGYGNQCWITFDEPWQWQVYMTLVSMTLFVIPAILIAACYIIIVCTIWNKGKELSVRAVHKCHRFSSI